MTNPPDPTERLRRVIPEGTPAGWRIVDRGRTDTLSHRELGAQLLGLPAGVGTLFHAAAQDKGMKTGESVHFTDGALLVVADVTRDGERLLYHVSVSKRSGKLKDRHVTKVRDAFFISGPTLTQWRSPNGVHHMFAEVA